MKTGQQDSSSSRRLAAVLFADIVGYTALMQSNEQEALIKLHRFKTVLKNNVSTFRGEIANFYGDGCLAVFESAMDVVNCAKALQLMFQEEPVIPVRMGIHSGDTVFKEGNVYGDAVNIASRIESMGIPGSVLLSSSIRNQIKNKPEFQLTSLGRFEFKNVQGGMTVYALANDGFPIPKREEMQGKLEKTEKPNFFLKNIWVWLVGLLIIAGGWWYWSNPTNQSVPGNKKELNRFLIMPFDVQGTPELQYLSTGMVDLLSTKLDGMGNIHAIDPNIVLTKIGDDSNAIRNPVFAKNTFEAFHPKNIILGNIVKLGDQIRFYASLYDENAVLISSAEVLTEKEENLLQVIDELTLKLIAKELADAGKEVESMAAISTNNLEALKNYLEGSNYLRNSQFDEAGKSFEAAVGLDSTFALGWYQLSRVYGWAGFEHRFPVKVVYGKMNSLYSNLPEKYQLFFDLSSAIDIMDTQGAESLIQKGTRQYSEDVEFLKLHGEYLFHFAQKKLESPALAKPYFQKVIKYQPNDTEVNIHLAEIALQEGDLPALDSILQRTPPNSFFWIQRKMMQILMKDSIHNLEALNKIVHSNQMYPFSIFAKASMGYNIPKLDILITNILELNKTIDDFTRKRVIHSLKIGRGDNEKIKYEQLKQIWADLLPQLAMGEPNLIPDKNQVADFKKTYLEDKDTLSLKDLWCLNIYNAVLKDGQAYDETSGDIKTFFQSEEQQDLARFYYYYCEVIRHRNLRNNKTALLYIDSLSNQKVPPLSIIYDMNFGMIHLIKGEILFEEGQFEEANRWFKTIPYFYFTRRYVMGLVSLRIGQCQEKSGNLRDALRHYNYLIELYQDCDEQYLPWVEEATLGRNRLLAKLPFPLPEPETVSDDKTKAAPNYWLYILGLLISGVAIYLFLRNRQRKTGLSNKPSKDAATPEALLEDEFLIKLKQVIETNLSDADFHMPQLCKAMGFSRAQVYRKIKDLTDKPPSLYIRSYRLEKAKELLQTTNLNVSEVAYEVGFKDPSYFSRSFSEEFGISPNETRK